MMKIPTLFHNTLTGAEFETCTDCAGDLAGKSGYVIEKSFRNYTGYGIRDVIWEFAVCHDCWERVFEDLSSQSKSAIEKYYKERGLKVYGINDSHDDELVGSILSKCGALGIPLSEESDYTVSLRYERNGTVPFISIAAISGTAMEDISRLLSAESASVLGDYKSRLVGPLPEFANPKTGVFI